MNIPSEIIVFLLSTLPLTELRASIPLGITIYDLSPLSALCWSLAGNTLISILILLTLPPVTKFLRSHFKLADRLLTQLFEKTRAKHSHRMSTLGHLALITFVAVPLPGSGGWTGSLVAHVFGVKFKAAAPLVTVGLIIAGIIVTLTTEGAINLLG
jgi:uncharacterized membrane protein